MRMAAFIKRNDLELIRDPFNLAFGAGFPLALLLLLRAIGANVPVPLFEIDQLSPGVAVFGLSFMALFSGTLVAKDRGSSFLLRLYTTPLRAGEFIFGYILPLLPLCLAQSAVIYGAAALLGLEVSVHTLAAVLFNLPAAWLFISLGLLCGSVLADKQVGGICGALLTNLTAWLSGAWFDLDLVGSGFRRAASVLPFLHAVELERAVLRGDYAGALPGLAWVSLYAAAVTAAAVAAFLNQMHNRH